MNERIKYEWDVGTVYNRKLDVFSYKKEIKNVE